MPLNTGQILNSRYRIVKLLGQGGFGAVYKAWDLNFNLPCAVKENLDTTAPAQRQFEREARLLRTLHHSNLPQVIDHFILPGQGQYLVMDFIEGEDLQSMIDHRGALPEAQVLTWVAEVCDALAYMHSQNPPIIHRDIKPANIKITPQGQATLVDFGIAKVFDAALKTTLGAQAITPGYSPPEQYGQGNTDRRSDLYALGATMYACLTGQRPIESVQRIMGTPLNPPRSVKLSISSAAEAVILKAMETRPEARFQTAAEMKAGILAPTHPSPLPAADALVAPVYQATQVVSVMPVSTAPAYTAGGTSAAATVAAAPPTVAKAPPAAFPWKTILITLVVVVILAAGGLGGYALLGRPTATATPTRTARPTQEAVLLPSQAPPPTQPPTQPPTLPPTALPTNTETPTTAPTPLPAPTDTPAPQPSPASTATPAAAAPLVVGGADKIAYINQNDVWVANLDGSGLAQLTQDKAAKTYLRWMPDGQALTYISGKCIQKVGLNDPQPAPVTCFNNAEYLDSFEISPDGKRVAISLDYLLYMLPLDFARLSQVNSHDGLKAMGDCPAFAPYQRNLVRSVRWSSDNQKVAAITIIPLPDGRRGDVISIFAVDRCIPDPGYEDIFPGESRFTINTYKKSPVIQSLGWDGKNLFALTGYTRNDGFGDLYIYNGRTHKADLQIDPIRKVCCYRDPQWSPDGNYLVFAFQNMYDGANSKTQLYLIRFGDIESGVQFTPLPIPDITNPLEKPQPVLRPVQN